MTSGANSKKAHVPAMSCQHCVHTIKMELGDLEGVVSVDVDLADKTVAVTWREPATWDRISGLLAEIGYPVAKVL